MKNIAIFFASVLGIIIGTLFISILGLISIFSPQYSDDLHQKLIDWAENDE
jgi:purine-cytosine permease-like protein